MTLYEKAEQYSKSVEELKDILMAEPKNKRFFEQKNLDGNLDFTCEKAIDEIMEKHLNAFEPIDTEETKPFENNMESPVEEIKVNDPKEETVSSDSDSSGEKPKVKRAKKKTPTTEVVSEIDTIPNIVLRRFYAENFNVKPEKIFYMVDASVKEKIDEKYIIIERESDYLFLKRTAAVISISK